MIHTYFVCYEGDGGVDNAEVDRDAPITTMADVRAIEKSLNIPMGGVRSWQLLRTDLPSAAEEPVRFTFTGEVTDDQVRTEDCGRARVFDTDELVRAGESASGPSGPSGVWVALRSWDETRVHSEWDLLAGRRIRVTVEIDPKE